MTLNLTKAIEIYEKRQRCIWNRQHIDKAFDKLRNIDDFQEEIHAREYFDSLYLSFHTIWRMMNALDVAESQRVKELEKELTDMGCSFK